ncbi:MAG: hypothetical protein Fur0019_10670 [Tibeticola sp.]
MEAMLAAAPLDPLARFRRFNRRCAQWAAVASTFAVSLPTAWLSISTFLFVLFWLSAGDYAQRWREVRDLPLARACLALLAWFMLATLWSPLPWPEALMGWWPYRKLLLLVLMLSILDEARWGWRMVYAFLAGFALLLLISSAQGLGWLPLNRLRNPSAYTSHIAYSTMLASAVWLCLSLSVRGSRLVWLWVGYAMLAIVNLFFINTGRTGQAIFLALLAMHMLQRWRWRGAIGAVVVVSVLSSALFAASPTFRTRVLEGVGDFEQQRVGQVNTSLAFRLEFWRTTLEIGARHPVLGGGVPSYQIEYAAVARARGLQGDRVSHNPHSEYLLIWTQAGLVGLALWLWLLWVQWRESHALNAPANHLAQGLTLTLALAALFNSSLLDNQDGHFFVLLAAALWTLGRHRLTV